MMKLTTLTCTLAIAGAVVLGAQSSETTTKTKIEVKDGKDVKVNGCVAPGFAGGFVLTNVADKTGTLHRYILVSDDHDFSKEVGHRVEIEGKVADARHGTVEIKKETKMEGVGEKRNSTLETSGDPASTLYLGVKHMTMVSVSCP